MTSKVKLKLRYLFFYLIAVSLTVGQTPFWKDLSGSPNFSLLTEGKDGILFATYGLPFSAQTPEDGLYRSTNGGLSWVKTIITGQVEELESNGKYIVTTRFQTFEYVRNYSTDNGLTWSTLVSTRSYQPFYFSLNNSGGIYALHLGTSLQVITCDLVLRRWKTVGSSIALSNRDYPRALRLDNANNLFVGTNENGLYVSKDSGKTWDNTLPHRSVTSIYVSPSNKIIVGTALKDTNRGGVYFSSDTGRTWKLLGLTQKQIMSLASDNEEKIYVSTEKGIYQYADTGTVWNYIGPKTVSFDDMIVSGTNKVITTSSSQGLYGSTNFGITWSKTISVREENVAKICLDNSNKIYLGTWGNRVYTSNYTETGWSQIPSGTIGDEIHAFTSRDSVVFAGTDRGLYRTMDRGTSWTNLTETTFSGNAYAVVLNSLGEIFIGTDWGIYHSTNQGMTWIGKGLQSLVVSTLATNQNDELFAGTLDDGLFRSTNDGTTWTYLGLTGKSITCLTINNDGNIFAGSYGGVYRSTDNGLNWLFLQFDQSYVNAILTKGNHIYAGTFNGVFTSPNKGDTWTKMSASGLRQPTVLSLAFDPENNLVVGTYQGGLYRSEQPLTGVEDDKEIPTSSTLFQNFPNPFNPSTVIRYRLSEKSSVVLKVFDVLGREVAELVNQSKEAGDYSVDWNAEGKPTGVYVVRLEISSKSGGFTHNSAQTKKIILMR